MEEKVLSLGKFSAIATGGHRVPWKISFFETSYTDQKTDIDAKRNDAVIFNPTYLTKVTSISNMLKFLNIKSLVIQVSNTRFYSQTLHF